MCIEPRQAGILLGHASIVIINFFIIKFIIKFIIVFVVFNVRISFVQFLVWLVQCRRLFRFGFWRRFNLPTCPAAIAAR